MAAATGLPTKPKGHKGTKLGRQQFIAAACRQRRTITPGGVW